MFVRGKWKLTAKNPKGEGSWKITKRKNQGAGVRGILVKLT